MRAGEASRTNWPTTKEHEESVPDSLGEAKLQNGRIIRGPTMSRAVGDAQHGASRADDASKLWHACALILETKDDRMTELITSRRLDLHRLSVDELITTSFIERNFENPFGVYTGENLPRATRVADVERHPENIRWYYRILVDRERNIAVGSTSFHSAPDERGMIEIGIGIAPQTRGNGYATEAIDAMWRWACSKREVSYLRYCVSPSNAPSMAIIAKFGFRLVGEQIDDEDGVEHIYELPAGEYEPLRRTETHVDGR